MIRIFYLSEASTEPLMFFLGGGCPTLITLRVDRLLGNWGMRKSAVDRHA